MKEAHKVLMKIGYMPDLSDVLVTLTDGLFTESLILAQNERWRRV